MDIMEHKFIEVASFGLMKKITSDRDNSLKLPLTKNLIQQTLVLDLMGLWKVCLF